MWEGLTETASCELALKALGEAAARALADDIPGAPLCLDPAAVTDLPLLPVAPLR